MHMPSPVPFAAALADPLDDPEAAAGLAMLALAWTALQSPGVEAVALRLRSGLLIPRVLAVRLAGPLAEAQTRRGQWTHAFRVADLMFVERIARGG
jgi:hypothetical protein